MTALERMEAIGRSGITISVCCGPCGTEPFRWTVQCLAWIGEEFEQPFAAHSFEHAIAIAETEIAKRGWNDVRTNATDDRVGESTTT